MTYDIYDGESLKVTGHMAGATIECIYDVNCGHIGQHVEQFGYDCFRAPTTGKMVYIVPHNTDIAQVEEYRRVARS